MSGLPGPGLVLQNNGADDLAVAGNGTFTFATTIAAGGSYAVTVKTQPVAFTCAVANGSGVMGSADVTNVSVTCTANAYTVGGTVSGLPGPGLVLQNNAADDLAVGADGSFTFATRVVVGASYAVTVKTQPVAFTCAVVNGSGVMGSADVTNVSVTCTADTYTVGGTIAGLGGATGLVLRNVLGDERLDVPANATSFTFTTRGTPGAAYGVTVASQPTNVACTVADGAGTIGTGNVTGIAVSCSSAVQAWAAPTRWGGMWQDSATMVQHAHFDAGGIVSDKGPSFAFTGATAPATTPMAGFPGVGTRYAGGPFTTEAVNYQAANAQALDLVGDMTVCAVIQPARNRPYDSYEHPIISKSIGDGKNTLAGAGWSLMQMHDHWCFHYEYKDANGDTHQFMSAVPALFANQDFHEVLVPPMPWPTGLGRPNPMVVVLCGGRSGDRIMVAANAWDFASGAIFNLNQTQDQTSPNPFPGPYTLDVSGAAPATIGGYHKTSAQFRVDYPASAGGTPFVGQHIFDGLILETAVWSEAATTANLQSKMAQFFGLAAGATYLRNREAMYVDASGSLRSAGRHAPRLDPARGYLFGLQGWNRVSYWVDGSADYRYPLVFPAGENLDLWTKTPGAGGAALVQPLVQLDNAVRPPNGSRNAGQLVTLPPGASLSIDLDQALPPAPGPANPTPHARRLTWDATGPVQGQLWIRPTSTGTLRIQKTAPAPGRGTSCTVLGAATTCEQKDVSFATLTAGEWNRVSLNGAFTADATNDGTVTTNKGTLVLSNTGASNLTFHAWGVQLTQLGGGADLGSFDPGEQMYDWSPSRLRDGEPSDDPIYPIDVLKLAPSAVSTAATGFCLAAEATMPSGLAWTAPFARARTAIAWVNNLDNPTRTVRIQVRGATGADAGRLCVDVTGASSVCAPVPAGFDDGNRHMVKACMSRSGEVRLYADASDVALATGTAGVSTPDMNTGTILVGNSDVRPVADLSPWNGYISRAAVCRDTGSASNCR